MSTAEQERTWDDWSTDSHRCRNLKLGLLMASVAESIPGWFTVGEFTRRFCETSGELKNRTARRYLINLEQVGLLDFKLAAGKRGKTLYFRWAGWPPPIQ